MPHRRGPLLLLSALLLLPAAPASASEAPRYQTALLPGLPMRFEVVGDGQRLLGYRVGTSAREWQLPAGDAVLVDERWWTPLRPLEAVAGPVPGPATMEAVRAMVAPAATRRLPDRLSAFALGDVTLDGAEDLVVSFRRPFKRNLINVTRPRRAWADAYGLSAHLGLFRPADLTSIWVAGTLVRPVTAVAACNGALAVAYGRLDEPGTFETGAWRWVVFGFLPVDPLPGPGTPVCVDIDGDGRTEPAITGRSVP